MQRGREDEVRTCRTCGKPEEPHNFRHPFVSTDDPYSTDGLGPSKNKQAEQALHPAGRQGMPIDPVLRIALINKGVITPDDLAEAQKMMQVLDNGSVAVVSKPRD